MCYVVQGLGTASDPIAAFLAAQERLGDKLTAAIDSTLSALAAALSAEANPSVDTVADATALMRGVVPDVWESIWEGPADPLEYIRAAAARVSSTPYLMEAHSKSTLVGRNSAPVSAGVLFSVAAFVSALRQRAARSEKVGVDALQPLTVWHPERLPATVATSVAATGAALEGLLLEGAVFDGTALGAAADATAAHSELPTVTLAWVPREMAKIARDHKGSGAAMMEVPLYSNYNRQSIILQLSVPVRSAAAIHDFVLSGTAAFVGK